MASNRATKWEIPESVVSMSQSEFQSRYIEHGISILRAEDAQAVKAYALDIRRGDVIHLESMGDYRNDGLWIYDGTNFHDLYNEIDDYGSVPSSFCIPEFPPWYWQDIIVHNSIVWFDQTQIADQMLEENVQKVNAHWVLPIEFSGTKWYIWDEAKASVLCDCNRSYSHLTVINVPSDYLNNYTETCGHEECTLQEIPKDPHEHLGIADIKKRYFNTKHNFLVNLRCAKYFGPVDEYGPSRINLSVDIDRVIVLPNLDECN